MPLCPKCSEQVVNKLAPNDIYVLHHLMQSTTGSTGFTRDEIFKALQEKMSTFQLGQALMRMELLDFIGSLKVGKSVFYYILPSGSAVLEILQER